jgi:hypothetical protein
LLEVWLFPDSCVSSEEVVVLSECHLMVEAIQMISDKAFLEFR